MPISLVWKETPEGASGEVGIMIAVQQTGYRPAEQCPVCGSGRSGSAKGFGPGAHPVMRAFYACGYTVTAASTSSGRMLVVGVGCRGPKAAARES
jgi:hypothetical protein